MCNTNAIKPWRAVTNVLADGGGSVAGGRFAHLLPSPQVDIDIAGVVKDVAVRLEGRVGKDLLGDAMAVANAIIAVVGAILQVPDHGRDGALVEDAVERRGNGVPRFQIDIANAAATVNIQVEAAVGVTIGATHRTLEIVGIAFTPGQFGVIGIGKEGVVAAGGVVTAIDIICKVVPLVDDHAIVPTIGVAGGVGHGDLVPEGLVVGAVIVVARLIMHLGRVGKDGIIARRAAVGVPEEPGAIDRVGNVIDFAAESRAGGNIGRVVINVEGHVKAQCAPF